MTARPPLFEPQAARVPLQLQQRDLEILKVVYEHRFIDTEQIKTFFSHTVADPIVQGEKTNEAIARRLYKLFHHGYLDRPKTQLELRIRYGNLPMIYALGDKGARVLTQEYDLKISSLKGWRSKNAKVTGPHILHKLMIAKFHVALLTALRDHPRAELIVWKGEDELRGRWLSVTGPKGMQRVKVLPDGFFGIRLKNHSKPNRAFFFLEAERGTSSSVRFFTKKVLAYLTYYQMGGHTKDFNIKEFRVLTVTTTTRRRDSLRTLVAEKFHSNAKNRQRFLFASNSDYNLETPETLLDSVWYGLDPQEPLSIIS